MRVSLKGLVIALSLVAVLMGLIRFRHEFKPRYGCVGTIGIKTDQQALVQMYLNDDPQLPPLDYEENDGVWFRASASIHKAGPPFRVAVFEAAAHSLNRDEQMRAIETQMNVFVDRYPGIEFGDRRYFLRTEAGITELTVEQESSR